MADHSRRIFEVGFEQLSDVPFSRLSDMLRVAPNMMRLENYRTVYGLVSKYLKDPRLRQVFTFHSLLIGGNPFRCSSIYLLIHWLERKWGVHYALGGTAAIIQGIVRLLEEMEVTLQTDTPVIEIEVSNGQAVAVHTAGGQRVPCDIVVSNADPSYVYKNMIAAKHRKRHTDRSVDRVRQSMSLFVAYFGAKKTWPELAHHTIILGPRYKGLLEDIFERKVLSDDFSLYLHAPTRTDPSMAPPGHEGCYVLAPVPNNQSGLNWDTLHDRYLNRILDALDQSHMPGLRENLVTSFAVDPRYFEGRLRSVDGAAFGPEPRLSQSAYFRYHNKSPDVDGLYFVGAGTHPGAGVPGVLSSACVLDRLVDPVQSAHRAPVQNKSGRATL
jgi:phytoene desaturase